MSKFMIVSRQRSGSGLLRTYLGSHPELDCILTELPFLKPNQFDEYVPGFDWQSHVKKKPFQKQVALAGDQVRDTRKQVLKYKKSHFPLQFYRALPAGMGFDVKYDSISVKTNFERVNVIHLIRRNTFQQAISKWIENYQQITHRPTRRQVGDGLKTSQVTFRIPPKELKQMILRIKRQKKKWRRRLKQGQKKKGYQVLTMYYEDICDPNQTGDQPAQMPVAETRRLCQFLDVSEQPLVSNRLKVNSSHYEEYIENWSRIKKLQKLA